MSILFDDASSQSLTVDTAALTAAPLTFACWAYPDSDGITSTAVSIGDKDVSNSHFSLFADMRTSGDPVLMQVRDSTGTSQKTYGTITLNAWNHLAGKVATFPSPLVGAYLNGAGSTASNTRSPSAVDQTAIGKRANSGTGYYFSGRLAEVGIWNTDLSTLELLQLYQGRSPLNIRPQNLVLYIPLVNTSAYGDLVGGLSFTASGLPSAAAHPRMLYRASPLLPMPVTPTVTVIPGPVSVGVTTLRPDVSVGVSSISIPIVTNAPTVAINSRYWVESGGSSDGDWSDTNHWSESSGGTGGASIPGSTQDAYIDANSAGPAGAVIQNTAGIIVRDLIVPTGLTYPLSLRMSSTLVCRDALLQSGELLLYGNSSLTWTRNLYTSTVTPESSTSSGDLFHNGTGWWKHQGGDIIYNLSVAVLAGSVTTLWPVGTMVYGSTDITVLGRLFTGGNTAALTVQRKSAGGDQTEVIEIHNLSGTPDDDGAGSANIDGLTALEHEPDGFASGYGLNNTWTFSNWHGGASGEVYDLTGGASSNVTYSLKGAIGFKNANVVMEKYVTLNTQNYDMSGVKSLRVGNGTSHVAILNVGTSVIDCSDKVVIRGNNSKLDLDTGSVYGTYLTGGGGSSYTDIGVLTGSDGGTLELQGTNPVSGTIQYYFSAAGNDTTGDGSIGSPWRTFDKAVSQIGPGIDCLFNRGDSFPASDGLTINPPDGTMGAYGSGGRPVIGFSPGYTLTIQNSTWEMYDLLLSFGGSIYSQSAPFSVGITTLHPDTTVGLDVISLAATAIAPAVLEAKRTPDPVTTPITTPHPGTKVSAPVQAFTITTLAPVSVGGQQTDITNPVPLPLVLMPRTVIARPGGAVVTVGTTILHPDTSVRVSIQSLAATINRPDTLAGVSAQSVGVTTLETTVSPPPGDIVGAYYGLVRRIRSGG